MLHSQAALPRSERNTNALTKVLGKVLRTVVCCLRRFLQRDPFAMGKPPNDELAYSAEAWIVECGIFP